MTTSRLLTVIGLIGMAAATVAAAPKKAATVERSAAPDKAVQELVQSCEAHKFETIVQLPGDDGKPHASKVKLCGNQGQSDADWIGTLKDAVKKAKASPDMPKAAKDQIVTAINAEIDRLITLDASRVTETVSVQAPAPASPLSDAPLERDYSSLPPLPPPSEAAPPAILLPPSSQLIGARPEGVKRTAQTPFPRSPVASSLTLRCASPGDPDRTDACDIIEPSTLLVLRADAILPTGTQLQFVRRGALHGELSVPALRQGQSTTLRLPGEVCAGVTRSRLVIEANGGSLGEYELRC